jgi:hypothetical protein
LQSLSFKEKEKDFHSSGLKKSAHERSYWISFGVDPISIYNWKIRNTNNQKRTRFWDASAADFRTASVYWFS